MDGAPGQLAVADLAATRIAHAARLAHRIGREIVVQHEVLAVLAFERVDHLLVLPGAQGGDAQRLGLAAREQGAAMGSRQHPHLGGDRPHGAGVAAVDAQAGIKDGVANDVGFQVLEQRRHPLRVDPLAGQHRTRRILGSVDLRVANLLLLLPVGLGQRRARQRIHTGGQRPVLLGLLGQRPGVLGGDLGQLDDRLDHRLEMLVAELDRAEHDVLGQLVRLAFHHQHALAGAGHDEIELGLLGLRHGRVQQVLAVDVGHTGGAQRTKERDAGQRQRGGAADQGNDVGIVLQIMAQHRGDDLHLVVETLGEQRADRPVDEPADQCLVLARPAFTLEEAARDATGGERLLLVIHGEREKVLAGLGGPHADDGTQHDRLAVAGEHGAVGLAGDLARLQHQLAAAPIEFFAEVIEHASFLAGARRGRGAGWRSVPRNARDGVSGGMAAVCMAWQPQSGLCDRHSHGPCGRRRRRSSRGKPRVPDRPTCLPPLSRRPEAIASSGVASRPHGARLQRSPLYRRGPRQDHGWPQGEPKNQRRRFNRPMITS